MSVLSIIPEVWRNGTRMLYASIKQWLFAPAVLSRMNGATTVLLAGNKIHADPFAVNSQALPSDRSTPEWMANGIYQHNAYEDHTEPFPSLPVFNIAECEEAAMQAAHAHVGLLPKPHPIFLPDLTPMDGMSAVRAPIRPDDDIFVHEAEARDALRTALHFAAGKARSRYQHSHPAFTTPKTPWIPYSSPLAGEMMKYIGKTYQSCRNSIRVAPPSQIRLELETCLILAFAPYVLSDAFNDAHGRSSVVPEFVAPALERGASGVPSATREVIQLCEEGLFDDGEDLLKMWAGWMWVVKAYIGVLVLRDRRRPRKNIIWA